MKKAFIQKLSIAMASALVITAAAPASANAAPAMKMNKKERILYLNEDNATGTPSTYDFSIKNKPAGYKSTYKFNWYSEDDSIVEVVKGGLATAKSVGQTTVKCDITKKKNNKLVTTAVAVVTVKANAETVTIASTPEENKMVVGSEFTFKSEMKNVNGGKATDKVEWFVSDSTIAEVDAKTGVVKALKPGKFTVTAKTYQSEKNKDKGYTCESETVEIEVVNTILDAKATKVNQLEVTFASDVDFKSTDFTVTNATTGAKTYVSKVTTDKNKVVLDFFANFTSGVTYKISVGGMDKTVDFVKGAVSKIIVEDAVIKANTDYAIKYKVLDSNGLDVTSETPVTWNTAFTVFDKNGQKHINLGEGVTAYVSVTYYGDYTQTTPITSNTATIKAVKQTAAAIVATTIDDATKTLGVNDFGTINMSVPKGTDTKKLFVKVQPQVGDTYVAANGDVTFESQNPEIAYVDQVTGVITTVAEGKAYINVKCGNITVPVVITVTPTARATSFTVTPKNGSHTGQVSAVKDMNKPQITVAAVDQNNAEYKGGTYKVELLDGEGILEDLPSKNSSLTKPLDGNGVLAFGLITDPTNPKTGNVVLRITYTDSNGATVGTRNVSFNVAGIDNTIDKYALNSDDRTLDKKDAYENKAEGKFEYKIYTKNAAQFFINEASGVAGADATAVKVVVKNASGAVVTSGSSVEINAKDLAVGTYTVIASIGNNNIDSKVLTIKDSSTAPTATLTKTQITSGVIGVTEIANIVNVTEGYAVKAFKFGSSDSSKLPIIKDFTTESVTVTGEAKMFNLVVRVSKTVNGIEREYDINLTGQGQITVKLS